MPEKQRSKGPGNDKGVIQFMSDQLVRAISKDGFVKATAVSTRYLTERARQIHKTLPVATAAPVMPQPMGPIKRASSTRLATPPAAVDARPRPGCPAVTNST